MKTRQGHPRQVDGPLRVLSNFIASGPLALLLTFSVAALFPLSPAERLAVVFVALFPLWVFLTCWHALGAFKRATWTTYCVLAILWGLGILPV